MFSRTTTIDPGSPLDYNLGRWHVLHRGICLFHRMVFSQNKIISNITTSFNSIIFIKGMPHDLIPTIHHQIFLLIHKLIMITLNNKHLCTHLSTSNNIKRVLQHRTVSNKIKSQRQSSLFTCKTYVQAHTKIMQHNTKNMCTWRMSLRYAPTCASNARTTLRLTHLGAFDAT